MVLEVITTKQHNCGSNLASGTNVGKSQSLCAYNENISEKKEGQKTKCNYYFGYLHQKQNGNPIPHFCIECEKVLQCLLNKNKHQTIRNLKSNQPLENLKSKIFSVAWNLTKKGYSENTVKSYSKKLKVLNKFTNLDDPESVKKFLVNDQSWKNSYKQILVNAYFHYASFYNLDWVKPKFKLVERSPYVPSIEELSMIIAASDRKYSLIFSILRDTGLDPFELSQLTLKNIDLENGNIFPNSTKDEKARKLKLESSTLAMLREYVSWNKFGLNERMFPSINVMNRNFARIRNRLAERLCKPKLKKFKLLDIRNYYSFKHQTQSES